MVRRSWPFPCIFALNVDRSNFLHRNTLRTAFREKDKPAEVGAYHPDEATAETIERVDFAYYKPTAQQERAAEAPQAEDPLYEAIKAGNIDAVKQLIDGGVDLNELPPRNDLSYGDMRWWRRGGRACESLAID